MAQEHGGFLPTSAGALEYRWQGPAPDEAPTLVFLHEGLGSLAMWRDVPAVLAAQTGCGALVYSRAGYGGSATVPLPRPVRFMHDEAEVLEDVLRAARIERAILVGHSDGASITIMHAGSERRPGSVTLLGLILEAPHVFTEAHGLASIARIRDEYDRTDLRRRLEKYHGANVDNAFRGWNDVWLHPDFKGWNIEAYLPAIDVPVLILQGDRDEYGTWTQVEAIARQVSGPVEVVEVPDCGHSPHREQPDIVLAAMAAFVRRIRA